MSANDLDTYKIVFLGVSSVGKTSIINHYMFGTIGTGCSTIGASYVSYIRVIEDKRFRINIWDTAGQERFRSLISLYYRKADCVVLVFDVKNYNITDLESFMTEFIEKSDNQQNTIFYLVGNKIDLQTPPEIEDTINNEQLLAFASKYSMTYYLVSAASGDYIRDLFDDIHRSLLQIERTEGQQFNPITFDTEKSAEYKCCYLY